MDMKTGKILGSDKPSEEIVPTKAKRTNAQAKPVYLQKLFDHFGKNITVGKLMGVSGACVGQHLLHDVTSELMEKFSKLYYETHIDPKRKILVTALVDADSSEFKRIEKFSDKSKIQFSAVEV